MCIHGRDDRPWDMIFAFHFLDDHSAAALHGASFAQRLRGLVHAAADRGEAAPGAPPLRTPDAHGAQIIGRFLRPADCTGLLEAWNAPDGGLSFTCFSPNHGFATLRGVRIDWWTEICFQCANAEQRGKAAAGSGDRELPAGFKAPTGLEPRLLGLLPERPFPIC